MKKFLSSILTIALLAASSVTAKADEYSEYVETNRGNFVGETSLDYHVYSSYYVTIPTSIGEYDTSGNIAVTMDNIEQGHHVEIYITNLDSEGYLTVTSDNGNTGKLNVLHDNGLYTVQPDGLVNKLYPESYTDTGVANTDISFDKSMDSNTKAGAYHGTVCFRVECLPD